MGRLIDADALIEYVDNQIAELQKEDDIARELTIFISEKIKELIKSQPTAYDVEKVVEQLEQQAEQYHRRED